MPIKTSFVELSYIVNMIQNVYIFKMPHLEKSNAVIINSAFIVEPACSELEGAANFRSMFGPFVSPNLSFPGRHVTMG